MIMPHDSNNADLPERTVLDTLIRSSQLVIFQKQGSTQRSPQGLPDCQMYSSLTYSLPKGFSHPDD